MRALAIAGAIAGWAGLLLQLYILLTGPLGPVDGLWRFLAFFTILMNLLSACMLTLAVRRKRVFSPARAWLQSASAVYMVMVGIVYVTLLQGLWTPQGLQLIADILLHYVSPLIAVAFWLLAVPKRALKWRDSIRWTGVPLLYLGYALARGAVDGFYPYPFIDLPQIGWEKVSQNSAALLAGFILLSLVFIAIGKVAPGRSRH